MNKYDGTDVEHWNWCKERPLPYEDKTFGAEAFPINAAVDQVWDVISKAPSDVGKRIFFKLKSMYGAGVFVK